MESKVTEVRFASFARFSFSARDFRTGYNNVESRFFVNLLVILGAPGPQVLRKTIQFDPRSDKKQRLLQTVSLCNTFQTKTNYEEPQLSAFLFKNRCQKYHGNEPENQTGFVAPGARKAVKMGSPNHRPNR